MLLPGTPAAGVMFLPGEISPVVVRGGLFDVPLLSEKPAVRPGPELVTRWRLRVRGQLTPSSLAVQPPDGLLGCGPLGRDDYLYGPSRPTSRAASSPSG